MGFQHHLETLVWSPAFETPLLLPPPHKNGHILKSVISGKVEVPPEGAGERLRYGTTSEVLDFREMLLYCSRCTP